MKKSMWLGIGLVAVAALLSGGIALSPTHAQTSTTTTTGQQQTDSKQKSTEKKNTAKQAETQTTNSKSAPMSGYRPDPATNY